MTPKEKLHYDIFLLFKYGNIEEGKKLMEENDLDYLEESPTDRWNWLHQLLMGIKAEHNTPRKTIDFFIQKGVPVNAQDIYSMTPLHYAMRAENADAAIALLEAGADPNIPNRDNLIPLRMAIAMPKRLDLLELMLEKGGDVNYYNGKDYLLEAIKRFKGDDPNCQGFIKLLEKYNHKILK